MGNCQAIDNASLIIQHPSGRVHHLFSPTTAGEIMKMNLGHYVALLLTTTLYSSADAAEKDYAIRVKNSSVPFRVTRIKLLRPTDTLVLGHVYRLRLMNGLGAKKLAKMKQDQKQSSDFDTTCMFCTLGVLLYIILADRPASPPTRDGARRARTLQVRQIGGSTRLPFENGSRRGCMDSVDDLKLVPVVDK
ncbi:hypothetical protein F511_03461 [Dorcoceras hygrometricum]|uniref:Uncharacterized protein n=1 Tax=Dorcoceras hygrometricum TaxID=472368 RepID=A0A2Z7DEF3_9LAMI|nr:hypothetical protein F511_03461 [Dorcoceras hygrometricum]